MTCPRWLLSLVGPKNDEIGKLLTEDSPSRFTRTVRNSVSWRFTTIAIVAFGLTLASLLTGFCATHWDAFWSDRAVRYLQSRGAEVLEGRVDAKTSRIYGIAFRNASMPVTRRDIKSACSIRGIKVLEFPASEATVENLRLVARMPELQQLRIESALVESSAVAELRNCHALEYLAVTMTLDDNGFAALRQLKTLRVLELRNCRGGRTAGSLQGMPLRELSISLKDAPVTVGDLQFIEGLPVIERLVVDGLLLTVEAVDRIAVPSTLNDLLLIRAVCQNADAMRRLAKAEINKVCFFSCEFSSASASVARDNGWEVLGNTIVVD
jgi:hypothetical protein